MHLSNVLTVFSCFTFCLGQSESYTTRPATTITALSEQDVYYDAATMTFKDTTVVYPSSIVTIPATTTTRPATTITYAKPQSALNSVDDITAFNDIYDLITSVSNVDPAQVTKAVADLESYYSALVTERPYIIFKVPQEVGSLHRAGSMSDDVYNSLLARLLYPYKSSYTSEVAALLTPFPSLSSEALSYMPVARSFLASSASVVAGIVTKDFNLTGPPPSYASYYLTSTGTSSGPAATVTSSFAVRNAGDGSTLLLSAGGAAFGMLILALL